MAGDGTTSQENLKFYLFQPPTFQNESGKTLEVNPDKMGYFEA